MFYEQFVTYHGYRTVLNGLLVPVEVAVFGLLIGIVIGTLIAVVRVVPKYKRLPRVLNRICDVYVGFFRGSPMVVQLLLGYYVLLPAMHITLNSVLVAVIVFGLNSGAYVSEIMRSGIQSIDVGQLEAARALGMTYPASMLRIVIPQAVKNIMPTLGNEFIVLIKETSVLSFIAIIDLTEAFTKLGDPNYEYIIPYLMLAISYLMLVLLITFGLRFIERRLRRSDRSH